MCFFLFSLQLLSKTFLILRRIQRDIKNVQMPPLKILSDFNETRIFSLDIQKNRQISNFIKIHPERAELHAGGRTDVHDGANCCCLQFCEHD